MAIQPNLPNEKISIGSVNKKNLKKTNGSMVTHRKMFGDGIDRGSTSSATSRCSNIKENKKMYSPYLSEHKVHSRRKQKGVHNDVAPNALDLKLHKANSDEVSKINKNDRKKVKKSILTLPNDNQLPVPAQVTVSDMNESEYDNKETNNPIRKSKKRLQKLSKQTNKRIEKDNYRYYNRDELYCTQLDIDLNRSSTNMFKGFPQYNKWQKSTIYTNKESKTELTTSNIWAMLRSINPFKFRPTPQISEESFVMQKKKKPSRRNKKNKVSSNLKSRQKDKTEYVANVEMSSTTSPCPSFSRSSSYDRITVIDKRDGSRDSQDSFQTASVIELKMSDRNVKLNSTDQVKQQLRYQKEIHRHTTTDNNTTKSRNPKFFNKNYLNTSSKTKYKHTTNTNITTHVRNTLDKEQKIEHINNSVEKTTPKDKKNKIILNVPPSHTLSKNSIIPINKNNENNNNIDPKQAQIELHLKTTGVKTQNLKDQRKNTKTTSPKLINDGIKEFRTDKSKVNGAMKKSYCRTIETTATDTSNIIASNKVKNSKPTNEIRDKILKLLYKKSSESITQNTPNKHANKKVASKKALSNTLSKTKSVGIEKDSELPSSTNRESQDKQKADATLMKSNKSKLKWSSEFIENVLSKIKLGVYYNQCITDMYSYNSNLKKKSAKHTDKSMLKLVYKKSSEGITTQNNKEADKKIDSTFNKQALRHTISKTNSVGVQKDFELPTSAYLDTHGNQKADATSIKLIKSKQKWSSDFIENVLSEIKLGVYYNQYITDVYSSNSNLINKLVGHTDKSMLCKNVGTEISIAENNLLNDLVDASVGSSNRNEVEEKMCFNRLSHKKNTIPGFDRNVPHLIIESLKENQVVVKHSISNVLLEFDVDMLKNAKSEVNHVAQVGNIPFVTTSTKVFKCKDLIFNETLPEQLCTILPTIVTYIVKNPSIASNSQSVYQKNFELTAIPEIIVKESNSIIMPQLHTSISRNECESRYDYKEEKHYNRNVTGGKFTNLHKFIKKCSSNFTTVQVKDSYNLLGNLRNSSCLHYIETPILVSHIRSVTDKNNFIYASSRKSLKTKPNLCTAIMPYVNRSNVLQPINCTEIKPFKYFQELEIEGLSTIGFLNLAQILGKRIINRTEFTRNNLNLAITKFPNYKKFENIISVMFTNTVDYKKVPYIKMPFSYGDDTKSINFLKTPMMLQNDAYIPETKNVNGVIISSSEYEQDKQPLFQTFKKNYKLLRASKRFNRQEQRSNIKKSIQLNRVNNIQDFLKVLGLGKDLVNALDGQYQSNILSAIVEMRKWIKEITQNQAFLILILITKKETQNVARFRTMILQGIAMNRITVASELDMEMEVIERENLQSCLKYEGISYVPASVENYDNLLKELYWIAKTTASDHQKPYDENTKKLIKSLLIKRKTLNPSYLRVMARYVGLGLLKPQGKFGKNRP